MRNNFRVVITPGEPAGIGPDLTVQLAQQAWPVELVICADSELLRTRAAALHLPLTLREYQPDMPAQPQSAGTLTVLPLPLAQPVTAGELCVDNSHYVLASLARACDGCLNGEFAALITGPVHKGVINDAGIPFSGHTEFFAERAGCDRVVMMLATEELRVALATTHLPLKDSRTTALRSGSKTRFRRVILILLMRVRSCGNVSVRFFRNLHQIRQCLPAFTVR